MSSAKEHEQSAAATDPAREFLDFWRNYFEQTAIQTRVLFESMQGGKPVEQLHGQWLTTLSESLDRFMRTPAFLDVLKQSLKRMTDMKVMQDQMAQSFAQQTGLPLASDITGVFERVNIAERAILKKLEDLDDRLKNLETALSVAPAEKKNTTRKKGDSLR